MCDKIRLKKKNVCDKTYMRSLLNPGEKKQTYASISRRFKSSVTFTGDSKEIDLKEKYWKYCVIHINIQSYFFKSVLVLKNCYKYIFILKNYRKCTNGTRYLKISTV